MIHIRNRWKLSPNCPKWIYKFKIHNHLINYDFPDKGRVICSNFLWSNLALTNKSQYSDWEISFPSSSQKGGMPFWNNSTNRPLKDFTWCNIMSAFACTISACLNVLMFSNNVSSPIYYCNPIFDTNYSQLLFRQSVEKVYCVPSYICWFLSKASFTVVQLCMATLITISLYLI